MKAKKIYVLSSLILVIVFATSCIPATDSSQTPSNSIPTLFVNTVIPTLTYTPTAIPTLSPELARARLLDLLANNNNCRLPCLWGITPGNSTYWDTQNILNPLISIRDLIFMNSSSNLINFSTSFIEGDSEIDVDFDSLFDKDGIVSQIRFQARVSKKVAAPGGGWIIQDIFDSETFGESVSSYMLSQVLTEQGIPVAMLVQTFSTLVKDGGGFRILLFYPEQGLFIKYETQMKIISDKVQGCFANAHLEFMISPLGQPDAYTEMLAQASWGSLWPNYIENDFWKPIDKATSMSLEQFYETFRQPTDKCIETPANIWPIP